MVEWIKIGNKYPQCSACGYYWKEQVVGPVGKGHSDIVEAKYCPNCGCEMQAVVHKKIDNKK